MSVMIVSSAPCSGEENIDEKKSGAGLKLFIEIIEWKKPMADQEDEARHGAERET